jgi:carbonic anhydrase
VHPNVPSPFPATVQPPAPAIVTRRLLLGIGGLTAGASLAGCRSTGGAPAATHPTAAGHASRSSSPDEALRRLKAGNIRFVGGHALHPHQSRKAREEVAGHQQPWALVHGCVDSRVSPELVFDQGIGDLFATRTAGTVLDDTIVGSMEFAASAPYAVREIAPVARRVPRTGDPAAYVDEVVRANVVAVSQALIRRSRIIRTAAAEGRTRVVPAVYDLGTGRVDWLSG